MFVTDSYARHQNAFANIKKIATNKTGRILGSLPTWLKEVPGAPRFNMLHQLWGFDAQPRMGKQLECPDLSAE